jgi:cytochrome c oxidase assembly factor CtaG
MTPVRAVAGWRAICLPVGLFLVWIAVASPVSWCESQSLTGHMVSHLLLMSLAPPLIWLGEPMRLLFSRAAPPIQMGPIRKVGAPMGHPAVCWLAATGALVGWHVPAALSLGMQSGTWHAIEQASFLAAGLFFWRHPFWFPRVFGTCRLSDVSVTRSFHGFHPRRSTVCRRIDVDRRDDRLSRRRRHCDDAIDVGQHGSVDESARL